MAVKAAGAGFAQFTKSERILSQLQAQFGTMQPGRLQALRKQFYSYIEYPAAGSTQLQFFGQALGNNGVTLEETNMPVQGSFGTSAFLIKGVMCNLKSLNENRTAWNGLDANSITTEVLGGFLRAGVLQMEVNAKAFLQINRPFLKCPPADGRTHYYTGGQVSATVWKEASAGLPSRYEQRFIVDPEIFIAAQQNFAATIGYPAGAIPIRATGIFNAETNPFYVGIILDGIEFRPVQ